MVPVASSPSIMTRPSVGSCSPAAMLKIVLLPQPDGPIRLTKRPEGTASVTSASAANAPTDVANVMLMPSMRSFVGDAKAHLRPRQPGHKSRVGPQILCQEKNLSNIQKRNLRCPVAAG